MLPSWLQGQGELVFTGSSIVDQIIAVLLKTSMFVAGALGFFLDNTIPGSEAFFSYYVTVFLENNVRQLMSDVVKTKCL